MALAWFILQGESSKEVKVLEASFIPSRPFIHSLKAYPSLLIWLDEKLRGGPDYRGMVELPLSILEGPAALAVNHLVDELQKTGEQVPGSGQRY